MSTSEKDQSNISKNTDVEERQQGHEASEKEIPDQLYAAPE